MKLRGNTVALMNDRNNKMIGTIIAASDPAGEPKEGLKACAGSREPSRGGCRCTMSTQNRAAVPESRGLSGFAG